MTLWKSKFKLALAVIFAVIVCDGLYLFAIWPDWKELVENKTPKSNFIKAYEAAREVNASLPRLRWHPGAAPKSQRLSASYAKPFIVAEDSRFYTHPGIDVEALADAMRYNWKQGRFALGASTISQQTVKNLFLSSRKNPLRKWHELVLTLAMESELTKSEILSLYLNVAEFGHGVFGITAAADYYYSKSWTNLNLSERIALAASLPSPRKHNPKTQTASFLRRVHRISRILIKPEEKLPPTEEFEHEESGWDSFLEEQDVQKGSPQQSIEDQNASSLLTDGVQDDDPNSRNAVDDLNAQPVADESIAVQESKAIEGNVVELDESFMTESDEPNQDEPNSGEEAPELQADFTPAVD